jgi:NTE family protein
MRERRRRGWRVWGLWFAVASGVAAAQTGGIERPAEGERLRIGLVLSGGGARGTAHVGVLKALEELRVPIDAIAGTSMGAVVGGLYASGLSANEIESVMTSLDWQGAFEDRPDREDLTFRRKQEDQQFLVKLPLGLKGRRFLLPRGLVQGQKLTQTLRRLTLPVSDITDFDRLPTPFRAVATDLETGEPVILGTGDLTTAMRASLSAPGFLTPVESDGRLLVDGGLAQNLPIDVARSMNVDVLIVVDVGFPLLPRSKLRSLPVISNQMIAILIRRDSDRQRATLGSRDIQIDPALGDASSFDFSIVDRAIGVGEQAARAATPRLEALSLPPEAYERYVARRAAPRVEETPVVEFVRVEPGSERYEKPLEALFGQFEGRPFDADAVAGRVTELYGQGNVEVLDYRLVREGEDYGLALQARRNSWGPNYLRFGLELQDDFEGNSSFNASARVQLSEINALGGEWVWDFRVGESPRIATEVFLPLSYTTRWFVAPRVAFELRNVPLIEEQQRIAEYRVRSFQYGLDFGRELGNWGELRAGVQSETGASRVRLGSRDLPQGDFDASSYFFRFSYDRLDDVNFPRRGQAFFAEWRGERTDLGSDTSADLAAIDGLLARSHGRDTLVLWGSAGTRFNDDLGEVRTLYRLGGFIDLSALAPDSIAGRHFGIARLIYYRKIGRGGEGILNVPTYAGLSLEAGNVWASRDEVSWNSTRKNASLFFGLDTFIGPVYLGAGFDDDGETAYYLFLGRPF